MLISCIIPTYNRFSFLLNAIESIHTQTYKNIEIIVVNDCSTQEEYYTYKFPEYVKIVHLPVNSRKVIGHPNPGSISRNIGMELAAGEYIAFLDDDDVWMPTKLEDQLQAFLKHPECKISTTEAYIGVGPYNKNLRYKIYLRETYRDTLEKKFINNKEKFKELINNETTVYDKKFLEIHNIMLTGCVMFHKSIKYLVGTFKYLRYAEDYDYWKRALEHTDCIYVNKPLAYIDKGHGDGRDY